MHAKRNSLAYTQVSTARRDEDSFSFSSSSTVSFWPHGRSSACHQLTKVASTFQVAVDPVAVAASFAAALARVAPDV